MDVRSCGSNLGGGWTDLAVVRHYEDDFVRVRRFRGLSCVHAEALDLRHCMSNLS